jgi:D-glycero-D-manno-heptose 1,7-bisphosphate phosphatase
MITRRAIFLDRDGVINKVKIDKKGPHSPRTFKQFELIPGVESALMTFHDRGYLNIIVTNQPDVSRGLMRRGELNKMLEFTKKTLPIDDILVCPHDDADNCQCRKPKPGLIQGAAKKWNVDLKNSFFIGDTWKDVEAAKAAGCQSVLINMPYNIEIKSDYRINNLSDAAGFVRWGSGGTGEK